MDADLEDCMKFNFPSFNEATRKSLCIFQENVLFFVTKTKPYESQISIIVTFINLFHVLVLTRESMRKSSINIIMAAVAFTDILSCFLQLNVYGQQKLTRFGFCLDSFSYYITFTDIILSILRNFSRRCSTWLCFFIALIRTLVVRNPLDPSFENLANPKAALFLILGVFLTSLPISVFKWFEYSIVSYETNILSCGHWRTILSYYFQTSDWFKENDGFILKTFETTDAIISNIIPCVLFPIVTFLLVKEIWKADKNRKKLISSANANDSSRTTKLVFYFSVTFFIAGFPYGINMVLLQIAFNSDGFQLIFMYTENFLSILVCANTSTHFIVCMLMSTQYREAVKAIVFCGGSKKSFDVKKASVISVTSAKYQ